MRKIKRVNIGGRRPAHPFTIELNDGARHPGDETIARLAPYRFHPGDLTRVRDDDRAVPFEPEPEAALVARAAISGRDLTVTETIIQVIDDNHAYIWYRFEGVEGRHISVAMTEPGLVAEGVYGIVLSDGGRILFVELDGVDGSAMNTEPKVLVSMGRPASHYLFGEPGHGIESILAEEEGPIAGQFTLNSLDGGGTWNVAAVPFNAGCSEVELAAARQVIERHAGPSHRI